MGVWRALFRAGGAGELRAQQPGELRAEFPHADARHPWRARFPHSVQPVARPVQRAAAAERPVAAGRVPGRESLDPEAAKLDPMVSRGAWLAGSVSAAAGWRTISKSPILGAWQGARPRRISFRSKDRLMPASPARRNTEPWNAAARACGFGSSMPTARTSRRISRRPSRRTSVARARRIARWKRIDRERRSGATPLDRGGPQTVRQKDGVEPEPRGWK